MSTRRERLENKIQKREEWAQKAEQRSGRLASEVHQMASAIPMGQPILVGHHSEGRDRRYRERIGNKASKSVEESRKADHHASKADGLRQQLDRSIFSDDADAIERLEEKVAALEAKRDAMKKANAKAKTSLPLCNYKAEAVVALNKYHGTYDLHLTQVEMTKAEYAKIHKDYKGTYTVGGTHRVRGAMQRSILVCVFLTDSKITEPPEAEPVEVAKPYETWQLTNLGAEIRRAKQRIKEVRARQEAQADAEAAGGVSIDYTLLPDDRRWCRVTFAEKPERDVLTALKEAGFRWGNGCWSGYAEALPDGIA